MLSRFKSTFCLLLHVFVCSPSIVFQSMGRLQMDHSPALPHCPSPNKLCHHRAAPFQESEWVKTGVLLSARHQLGERRAESVRGWLGKISGLKRAEQNFSDFPEWNSSPFPQFLSWGFWASPTPTAAEFVSRALNHDNSCGTRKHRGLGTQLVAAYWRGNWGPGR